MKNLCLCVMFVFCANLLHGQAITPDQKPTERPNSYEILDIIKKPDGSFRMILAGDKVGTKEKMALIVVNGTIVHNKYIDPDKFKSVDVLAEKEATARYGTAGENGAIIITTADFAMKL